MVVARTQDIGMCIPHLFVVFGTTSWLLTHLVDSCCEDENVSIKFRFFRHYFGARPGSFWRTGTCRGHLYFRCNVFERLSRRSFWCRLSRAGFFDLGSSSALFAVTWRLVSRVMCSNYLSAANYMMSNLKSQADRRLQLHNKHTSKQGTSHLKQGTISNSKPVLSAQVPLTIGNLTSVVGRGYLTTQHCCTNHVRINYYSSN